MGTKARKPALFAFGRCARVGLGASTVYRYLAAGKFPKPVEIGGGRVAWLESEIDAWIANRPEAGWRSPE
ncbi:AlpA family transcriptional regulator [Paraburkholderia sp. BL21I4N1]|uniref:helix-turn-helix transcriptional regulator n=1 Tax=Paraburkholderia sp. BL21I4N1 TaxID=1938801 RepID=UPI0021582C01|nr:AlpA family phage regulatory protein [Paraburkholderia sp. BL21I4N1]